MAASAGFKQQCPSCEAMVPIKDPSFIGRKIDCPKCKYRFVVEDPGADEDADEVDEAPPARAKAPVKKGGKGAPSGVTAKKPANGKVANGKAANGKGAAVAKKKPGAKARRDEDEDEDEAPAK